MDKCQNKLSAGTAGKRDDVSAEPGLEFPMLSNCTIVVSTATTDRYEKGDVSPFILSVIAILPIKSQNWIICLFGNF